VVYSWSPDGVVTLPGQGDAGFREVDAEIALDEHDHGCPLVACCPRCARLPGRASPPLYFNILAGPHVFGRIVKWPSSQPRVFRPSSAAFPTHQPSFIYITSHPMVGMKTRLACLPDLGDACQRHSARAATGHYSTLLLTGETAIMANLAGLRVLIPPALRDGQDPPTAKIGYAKEPIA
jgi:hypothetical protein